MELKAGGWGGAVVCLPLFPCCRQVSVWVGMEHLCCPHCDSVWSPTGISPEVNELLMEAQLLQVSLPEIQELYQTLLAKPSPTQQAGRSSPIRTSSEKVGLQVATGGRF